MDSNDSRSSSSSINLLNGEQVLHADSLEHDLMYKKFQSLDCDQEFESAVRKCENNENINTNYLDQKPLTPDILSGEKSDNLSLAMADKKAELFIENSIVAGLNETIAKGGQKKPRKNKKSTLKPNQSLNNSNSSNENDPNSSSTWSFFVQNPSVFSPKF